ncbi:MAG: cobyric acid synthase [archaeon]|nr:cobyric acid synthase [archaeon]
MSKCLMIQGTSSDAGKSLITTALCRIYANRGYKVAPFKSQNMSLHSQTIDNDKEIAIAQIIQAKAAKTKPNPDMNPVLLKPNGDFTSQVIIHGTKNGEKNFLKKNNNDNNINFNNNPKEIAKQAIEDSLNRLKEEYDIIIMEGAGSPAEINLRKGDLANMGVAEIADANVLLVGDIDKGGVFASIAGTFTILDDNDTSRIKGTIINKFRGNPDLLTEGIEKLEKIVNTPNLGIIPYTKGLNLPAEDSISKEEYFNNPNKYSINNTKNVNKDEKIVIGVLNLEKIANLTEFDSLKIENDVELILIDVVEGISLDNIDALIIPDTINSKDDIKILIENKLGTIIKEASSKIMIVGICGGYEILKNILNDELLDNSNDQLSSDKLNKSELDKLNKLDKNVFGTSKHGIFNNYEIKRDFLNELRSNKGLDEIDEDIYDKIIEDSIEKIAKVVEDNLDMNYIDDLILND